MVGVLHPMEFLYKMSSGSKILLTIIMKMNYFSKYLKEMCCRKVLKESCSFGFDQSFFSTIIKSFAFVWIQKPKIVQAKLSNI